MKIYTHLCRFERALKIAGQNALARVSLTSNHAGLSNSKVRHRIARGLIGAALRCRQSTTQGKRPGVE